MKMPKIRKEKSLTDSFYEHVCKLKTEADEDVVTLVIDSGIFINLRRKLCRLRMLNKYHPQTQHHFKSRASRRREEMKHLANYKSMTHPFSILCLYWEFFMLWIYLYMYLICSISVCYWNDPDVMDDMNNARFVGDYIQIIDIIHLFWTGYYAVENNRTIMKPADVAKHYLKTYFFVDLISTVPSHILFLRWAYDIHEADSSALKAIRILTVLKIFRMNRCLRALELFRQYMDFSSYWFKAIKASLTYIILILLLHAALFCWAAYLTDSILPETILSTYCFTMIILTVSTGEMSGKNTHSWTTASFFVFLGYLIQLFLYAQVMQVWNKFVGAGNKNKNLLRQFKQYMRYKGLPLELRHKIFTYFSFKFQNEYFNETQINSILSDTLKQEILMHITKNHLQKAQIFKGVPEAILVKIVSHLKSEIYLSDDVIVTADTAGPCMYFIYFGTVAVYTAAGKEICHLEDGANFGEISLVFNQPRIATVVAVTPCELFKLKRPDFLNVLEPFADIKSQIIANARDRLLDSKVENF